MKKKLCTFFGHILWLILVVIGVLWVYLDMPNVAETKLILMRLARDVSRYKSRARLDQTQGGIIALSKIISGNDEMPSLQFDDHTSGISMTIEELKEYDGRKSTDGTTVPLYLAIKGRIYDVSAGAEYYGPGRSYHHFVGRDASRAFATGCCKGECLISSLKGLAPALIKEVDRWVELYEYHDKYKFVGLLIEDPVEKALENSIYEEKLLLNENGNQRTVQDLKSAGGDFYAEGNFEDAEILWRGALIQISEATSARESILPKEELERADLLNLMATLAQKNNNFQGAINHYEEALDILKMVLDEDAFSTFLLRANILADLATAQLARTDKDPSLNDAFRGLLTALQIFEAQKGDYPISVAVQHANTLLNTAKVAIEVGKIDDAKAFLQDIKTRFSDEDHSWLERFVAAANEGLQELENSDEGVIGQADA